MSWTRLESATRDPNLAEGLEARVADPCWMLARQWQTGEFKGDDAANPLLVTIEARSVPITTLRLPGGDTVDLAENPVPLEPLVEREPIRDGPGAPKVSVELGRLLARTLRRVGAPEALLDRLRARHPVALPAADHRDPVGWRRLTLQATASLDGSHLLDALEANPDHVNELLTELGIKPPLRDRIVDLVDGWRADAEHLFSEPRRFATWDPQRMEYRFGLDATDHDGRPIRLSTAEGYAGGRLDWYSFDRVPTDGRAGTPGGIVHRAELLPAPLRFRGMPADRFWELEEGDVYLGGIEAAPEDLARVAVAGYAVVHGNDWFVVPLAIPHGTLTTITELTVLDDFGRTTRVRSAAEVDGGKPNRAFKFFELSGDPNPANKRAPLLFLPPTVASTEAGRPLEDVRFVRDELANLAWAVEQRIESAAGRPVDVAARGASAPIEPAASADDWNFELASMPPANWVPLVPVRVSDDGAAAAKAGRGQIMFQRGRVPVSSTPGASRGAQGTILVPRRRLLIHEDEIPSAGLRVVRRYQSARDSRGRLHTWVGRRKGPGRGEGDSGLVFDVLDTATR